MKNKKDLMNQRKLLHENMSRKKTFEASIKEFLEFRDELYDIYQYIFDNSSDKDYEVMPLSTDKTIAYYIYHLTRIEDITLHTLIMDEEQIFHSNHYQKKLGIGISTTGNELNEHQIIDFSKQIDIKVLKVYVKEVYQRTNEVISQMSYKEIRTKVSEDRKNKLVDLGSVSKDESAFWLVDYWCKKDYLGLVKMPFTSHQFLHLWGCLRILTKLSKSQ